MSANTPAINNLNIFTFITDIYRSLKHIDQSFSNVNESIITRLSKIEDTQQIILDKLTNYEQLLLKINEQSILPKTLDKQLEHELLAKMNQLNDSSNMFNKIDLKPNELTFENILENNYSLSDINNRLTSLPTLSNLDSLDIENIPDTSNILQNKNTLNTLNTLNTSKPLESLDTLLF